jgi:hypothetical protein
MVGDGAHDGVGVILGSDELENSRSVSVPDAERRVLASTQDQVPAGTEAASDLEPIDSP